ENARLFNELQTRNRDLTESLDQQTATSEILRVISRSPTDVQPVFDTIVQSAVRLCNALSSSVYRFDGELLHFVAQSNFTSEALEAARQPFPAAPSRDNASARAIFDCALVHIPDVLDDPEYRTQDFASAMGIRSVLSVPMMREGRPIGVVTVYKTEPGPFSGSQVGLLQTFADQAVIAVENTRLFNELDRRNRALTESLEQQTATSDILRVISQSQRDVQPVFDAIAANAMTLCRGTSGWVFKFDGKFVDVAAGHGLSPEGMEASRRLHPRAPGREGTVGRAILNNAISYVPDIREDPEYRFQGVAEAAGFLSSLSVPLLREGSPIGTITVTGAEPAMFTERQIAMLQTFADQAVIAIENTRLFNELQEQLEQQTATSEILRVISQSQRDVQPVFETIAENARKLCEATQATVSTFDGQLIHIAGADGLTPDGIQSLQGIFPRPPGPGGDSAMGRAIVTRKLVYIEDIREDEEYRLQAHAQTAGFLSVLSVPMFRNGSAIGAITVSGAEAAMFSERQIAMLQTFADQAVIAIENTRLFNELQARTGELGRSVEELRALGEVGSAVSSTLDVDTVLTTILTHANKLAGTQAGQIVDYDEATQELSPRATLGYTEEIAEALRRNPIKRGEGVAGRAVATREPVQVPDIATEGSYDARLRDLIMDSGFRALL